MSLLRGRKGDRTSLFDTWIAYKTKIFGAGILIDRQHADDISLIFSLFFFFENKESRIKRNIDTSVHFYLIVLLAGHCVDGSFTP
jgi:hypothetical protein